MDYIILEMRGEKIKVSRDKLNMIPYFNNIIQNSEKTLIQVDRCPILFNSILDMLGDYLLTVDSNVTNECLAYGIDIKKYPFSSSTPCQTIRCGNLAFCGDKCNGHTCQLETCQSEKASDHIYCLKHECEMHRCLEQKTELSLYCKLHTCADEQCNKKLADLPNCFKFSKFCINHKCFVEDCIHNRIPNKKFCNIHACPFDGCNNSKYLMCHLCKYSGCENMVWNPESTVCMSHKCEYDGCCNAKTFNKKYCKNHTCYVVDCIFPIHKKTEKVCIHHM